MANGNGFNLINGWTKLIAIVFGMLVLVGGLVLSYGKTSSKTEDLQKHQEKIEVKVEKNEDAIVELKIKLQSIDTRGERMDTRQQVIESDIKKILENQNSNQ